MTQSRTHTCNELRLSDAGKIVTLVGWYENLRRVSKNLGFLILRDFYGTTQIVIETEEMMEQISGVNTESTISVTGTVRERSSKNTNLPTGEIEVVPRRSRSSANVSTMSFLLRSTVPRKLMKIPV